MMKRTGITRLGVDEPAPLPPQSVPAQIQQAGASNMHTLAQTAQPQIIGASTMLSVSGFGRGPRAAPPVINYLKAGAPYQPPKQPQQQPARIKFQPSPAPLPLPPLGRQSPGAPPAAQFQRLKVEDALSYLDQVKYKFNTQPQVYNDFLDIMKEFKSQTIDTPGVITRVSNLFKGHTELIVGFNTFLPPGYKIEVQSNGQVSVSMPSPTGCGGVVLSAHLPTLPPLPTLPTMPPLPTLPPQQPALHMMPVPVAQTVPIVASSAIVHNLSVSAPPANTLHHISQAHQQIEAAAIHHQSGAAPPTGAGAAGTAQAQPPGQPVEFNHAIEYVNKIKSRFARQPDKYKRFLEILHAYQRGHRDVKEPQQKQQTEQEVYSQVAKLFENQEDLLAEFGQFLPDAKAVTKPHYSRSPPPQRVESECERFPAVPPASPPHAHHNLQSKHAATAAPHHLKRSPSFSSVATLAGAPPPKKPRVVCPPAPPHPPGPPTRDVSRAEAARLATLHDYNFFDRVRRALKGQHVYDNFLKCLLLFTNEIISSSELVVVTAPFLCRHPELQKWLTDFLGLAAQPTAHSNAHAHDAHTAYGAFSTGSSGLLAPGTGVTATHAEKRHEPVGAMGAQLRHERPQGDAALDVDLSTCKRLGTSYCALPRDAAPRRCSGRTALCREVLNDTWVSFPTWSEDSTFVTSRKTQYEEYIYRCEDERFELDVVIETNAATIRVLEGVQKKLTRMSPEEAAKYRLDECLGGHSPTIHQRALRRIYGDKAVDIIAGLKKNPLVAVPVVLRRLKAKEEEWREAQKGFNKQWREQNEKYYLKSLDHQGINFKQNDLKALRSKALFNDVEAAYSARRPPPHLVVDYGLHTRQEAIKIVRDAAELLIHHARRQTAIQKGEKRRIKQLLRHFLPDLFAHPRQPLSDDERDNEEKDEPTSPGSPADCTDKDGEKTSGLKQEKHESSESDNASDKSSKNNKNDKENKLKNNNTNVDSKDISNTASAVKRVSDEAIKPELKTETDLDDDYRDHPPNESRFVCTMSWYLFLRLHGVLCARLAAARAAAAAADLQHHHQRHHTAVAQALRLRPTNLPCDVSSPSQYYSSLLELVKGVLDGNTEPSAFEDAAREMFGIKAYPAYTLDKVVSIAVRQLQHCVSEPWSWRCAELCARGRRLPSYRAKALAALASDQPAFLVRLYGGDECKVTFELLEGAADGRASPHDAQTTPLAPNGATLPRLRAWALYTERYAHPAHNAQGVGGVGGGVGAPADPTPYAHTAVFLRRNARRCGARPPPRAHATVEGAPQPHRASTHRRKPPRINDTSECVLSPHARMVVGRPLSLYRAGSLLAARASQPRLRAARQRRLHSWLASNATANADAEANADRPKQTHQHRVLTF